jgi:ABC-2 type transport system ATP-binding protein
VTSTALAPETRVAPQRDAWSESRARAARPAAISTRALVKSFPTRRGMLDALRHPFARPRASIIRAITFEVHDRELFGILGLNGAGKTTLLKMLATLILPDGGTASVCGRDVIRDSAGVRELLAMVTADERSLNWRLSGRENLRLFAGLHRMSARDTASRIDETLAAVGLETAGDKLVGAFSSGMRQRLLLARALLSRPQVLLLDEPTRSLDPVSAHEFRRLLRDEIVGRQGATVVIATHNTEEAFAYCDRIAVLHHGQVAALGSANALAARFAQDRYRIWTTSPNHPCFAELMVDGFVARLANVVDVDGRTSIECEIGGGESAAATVLRRLVESGVVVHRFERVPCPLPTLIARVVEEHETLGGGSVRDA